MLGTPISSTLFVTEPRIYLVSTFYIWQMNGVFSCGPPMVKAIL